MLPRQAPLTPPPLSIAASPLPLKLLLVEDNLTNQKVALRQLQILGYQADVVQHGQAALLAITQMPYDLVLMDCQMPVLDGYDTTQAIRELEQRELARRSPSVIIAMTANDLGQERRKALAVGMDDYLVKPVRLEELAAVLDYWSQLIVSKSDPLLCTTAKAGFSPAQVWEALKDCFDLDHLHQISDDSPEFELELLKIFVEDSQTHLRQLQAAILAQAFWEAEQSAHHIKGASANVGARRMRAVASEIEQQMMQQQLYQTENLLDELEAALQQICQAIGYSETRGCAGNAFQD